MYQLNEKKLTPEEKWEQATIANNFIFYKIMRNNPNVCQELLEILLEMDIDHIEIRDEETVEIDFGSKGIRLDVYAKNNTQVFNLEMQVTDTKELPERARYYQGSIDVDCLKSGQVYKQLKDSYVIFICIPDIFEKGYACYCFENLCREDHSIHLNDRTYKYFFIAQNCDKILNEKQKAFLQVVLGRKASDKFSKKIQELTEEAKHNTQWRRQYMEWERQRTYDFENGKEAKNIEAVIGLHENGVSIEIIAKSLKIPEERVNDIIKQKVPINI
jgi:predicted transposase/invertase (TIGR01784 family)